MKLNPGYVLRELAGEFMLVNMDASSVDLNGIYSLSESAAWLWRTMAGREFSVGDAVNAVLSEYDVSELEAGKDVASLLEEWGRYGMIMEEDGGK